VLPELGLALLLSVVAVSPAGARDDVSRVLTFEAPSVMALWSGGPSATMFLDSAVVHEGRYAGRLERDSLSSGTFSAFTLAIPVDFKGNSLELRGWVRYEGVQGKVGLWQRQDAPTGVVAFDNMDARDLHGNSDWTELSLVLPLRETARSVKFGALLSGTGRLWVDDLRLFVDGRPLANVPVVEREQTVLDRDHAFDKGSRVTLASVTPVQAENLALLGRIWGFLKYHHPAIVDGQRHWDYELFRILPAVAAARSTAEGRRVLAAWVDTLPPAPALAQPATLPPNLALAPSLDWLRDRRLLGAALSARLVLIHEHRPAVKRQFYAAPSYMIGNPDFSTELGYRDLRVPDAGYRLLALFRFWNAVEYWYPDRDQIGEDWPAVLREFVPRLVAAHARDDYALAMMTLIGRIHDSHANLWSTMEVQPPRGEANAPVLVRFIEGRAVVTGYAQGTLGPASGLRIGDVVRTVDGVPVDSLVNRWRPLYAASNEASRLRDMAMTLLRGDSSEVRLSVERADGVQELNVRRVGLDRLDQARAAWVHDVPGPTCRRLSDDLAYLKLSSVRVAEVDEYLQKIRGAKCLVLDLRNYPKEFMVFAFGSHLVQRPTPFAVFTGGDYSNPGAATWGPTMSLTPATPAFEGRVAILVDEITQSSAEYTTMAFRATPGAVVVGSTTAGADGNVSALTLPGGFSTMFSGLGVFTPDRHTTQRVGIVPDVVVRPTIAGIRAGRDEVLETAVHHVLGRDLSATEIAALHSEPAAPGH